MLTCCRAQFCSELTCSSRVWPSSVTAQCPSPCTQLQSLNPNSTDRFSEHHHRRMGFSRLHLLRNISIASSGKPSMSCATAQLTARQPALFLLPQSSSLPSTLSSLTSITVHIRISKRLRSGANWSWGSYQTACCSPSCQLQSAFPPTNIMKAENQRPSRCMRKARGCRFSPTISPW